MQIDGHDENRKILDIALEGLRHPLPQVRAQYAKFLSRVGGSEALGFLKEAYVTERNILCKTEMVRAIVSLEEKLGLPEDRVFALEGTRP